MMRSTPIRRVYSDFRGVDFANDPSLVLLSRSPDALNVWKNYKDTQGSCIESRPGYRELANFEDKINGMYFYNDKVLIHSGTNLYLWDNFPSEPTTLLAPLKNNMNDAKSTFAIFNEKLYIVDGANYLVYDGTTLKNVSDDDPYIPTTTISRSPSRRRRTLSRCKCFATFEKEYFRSRWNINRILSRHNRYKLCNRS